MADDPINPKHYAGTACAQIGERLTGNSYQVLKYNWRLGKKDTATIEVGKSIWYLDREIELAYAGWRPSNGLILRRTIGSSACITIRAITFRPCAST